jgi:CubicO group peptidase (beta-lactamase class C family)
MELDRKANDERVRAASIGRRGRLRRNDRGKVMNILRAWLATLAMASGVEPALAQFPSTASCLVGCDKVALTAGVQADSVKNTPECHLTWQEAGVMVGFPPPLDKRVTPDNVFRYPFVRWTLQNTSLFTRTASMLAERPAARPIPEALDDALLSTQLMIGGARKTIADYAAKSFTDALVVTKDGKLVAEWYGDGMSASKPHYISSVTKGAAGLLAELLIADGRLDENRPVKSYVPELAATPFGDATVRDVLDMKVNVGAGETSGATDVADAALWSTMALNSRQSAYDTLAAVKADGPNDGNFHYASMTTEVAGWVITRAAGQPYEKLASDLLWSKLGLQDDIVEPVDPTGKVYASTGLTISARDLAKLGLMIADHGKVDSRQVFPANAVDRLYQYGDAHAWQNGNFKNNTVFRSYRSYWYQLGGDDHALMGLGVFGQGLYINPTTRVVMVRLSSLPAHTILESSKGWDEIRVWLDKTARASR